jgi:hypothetical protein
MIRYTLECEKGHGFDGWFSNSEAFDRQAKRSLVTCPECGSTNVSKSIMAPNVSTTKGREVTPMATTAPEDPKIAKARKEVAAAMRKLRETVEANAEYVGPRFAEEARKIHYEETERRGIYGEASLSDVKELHDEGIECHPLPVLPEEQN